VARWSSCIVGSLVSVRCLLAGMAGEGRSEIHNSLGTNLHPRRKKHTGIRFTYSINGQD
jgi:hypothetical protein